MKGNVDLALGQWRTLSDSASSNAQHIHGRLRKSFNPDKTTSAGWLWKNGLSCLCHTGRAGTWNTASAAY